MVDVIAEDPDKSGDSVESGGEDLVLIICRCAWFGWLLFLPAGVDVYSCHVISVVGVATLVWTYRQEAGDTFDGRRPQRALQWMLRRRHPSKAY
jgi:hypothetical protein